MATEAQFLTGRIVSHNPATGEVLGDFPSATPAEVHDAVERARKAQPAWAALGVRERVAVLRRFQRLLHQRKCHIARTISREAGKPYVEALSTEVLVVLDAARFCVDKAYRFLRHQKVTHGSLLLKAKRGRVLREPLGVIGIISPWNYPFSIPATETLAALVMGNAVVLKPSEFTPIAGSELVSLLHAAGVPDDVVQVVIGDGAAGAALLSSPIDKLIFTGSVPTGKRVAQAAAERLLPVVLELGGKDAMIILEDADVDVAAAAAVWGAFMNAGQTCLSVERCYVSRKIHDRFLAKVLERTRELRVGDGLNPETDIGPMINERQLHIVEAQIADALLHGAQVLAGGMRLKELGPNFFAPTVVTGVDHSMTIMRDETFGPVLPIMPFGSEEEAVQLANDSHFGLAASIWTRNRRRGEKLAARIDSGTVMVNDVLTCFGTSEAPHGGFKSSGIGRTHGTFGLEEMVRVKYLDTDLLPRLPKPWWHRYGPSFAPQLEAMMDFLFGSGIISRLGGGLRSLPALLRNWR
jgi:succinate-semialdehyde dehydrogenase/glutarate-semialdehyde dehydrogenase